MSVEYVLSATRSLLLATFGWVLATAPALAQTSPDAQNTKPPIADFFRSPNFQAPRLSPDGKRLAAIIGKGEESRGLAVIDLGPKKSSKIVAAFADVQIANVFWVNDKRLIFTVRTAPGLEGVGPGLWAVDSDGENMRQLISPQDDGSSAATLSKTRVLPWDWFFYSTLEDGSDDVIIQNYVFDTSGQHVRTGLARLNTRNLERTPLGRDAPGSIKSWSLDHEGQPMWATTWSNGKLSLLLKKDASAEWTTWATGDLVPGLKTLPIWVGPNREVYALQSRSNKATAALYRLDPKTMQAEAEPLVLLDGYDLDPTFVYDAKAKRLVGLHFLADAESSIWFDPIMKQTQAEVDKLLPSTVNMISCTHCIDAPVSLVSAFSDRTPTNYFLYDRDSKELTPVASSRPWIDSKKMARVDVQQFAARDGLNIPVQITLPNGSPKTQLPTVVLVHGGPSARGNHWGWHAEAQFLASRGFLVVEPEFRGSTGYGFKHFQAGWKKWGQEMQDDVTDATRWAIQKGLADPKRICIAGASYGGYATLMGLIREPELYQCGINWVGVTDIELLFTVNWSDASDVSLKYGLPLLVGDRKNEKDLQAMRANSPLLRAAEIKRPLLMAYGEDDRRVPAVHGTKLRDAIKPGNSEVEWVSYVSEGHGWTQLKTNEDFWGRVERFLDKHIGAQVKP